MKKFSRAVFILTLVFACVICDTANAAICFVKQGGTGNGSNWGNASGNLKNILDNANAGDVIYVASGDYRPGSNANDTFNLKKGISLYGGYDPASTGTNLSSRDISAFETKLNGGGTVKRSVAVVTGGTNATNADTRIDGFTVTGG